VIAKSVDDARRAVDLMEASFSLAFGPSRARLQRAAAYSARDARQKKRREGASPSVPHVPFRR
jgi:hypothetical protein